MKLADIKIAVGGDISTSNSKMPGASFGLSTDGCGVGSKLRHVKGSTCEKCYAKRLENMRPSVRKGWTARLEAVMECETSSKAQQDWIAAMVQRIDTKCAKAGPFFRWHDSGDLQGIYHLWMINDVAKKLPHIQFWLPTREKGIVRAFIRNYGELADNLTVRLSAAMVDAEPVQIEGVNTSTVHKHTDGLGHTCPASKQGNSCGDCRACWDSSVANVSYPLH